MIPQAAEMPEPNVHGETIVYRLFDVGFAIHLDQASALLSSSSPERLRPVRGEARRGYHLMGRRFSRLLADLHTRVALIAFEIPLALLRH